MWEDKEAFIFGRRSTGNFDIRDGVGKSLHKSIHARNLRLLERSSTLLVSRASLPPHP
jgi:hypothetical protein